MAIEQLPEVDFGHATSKPVSLTIELSKPFTFDHPAVLKGGFADVADIWSQFTVQIPSFIYCSDSLCLVTITYTSADAKYYIVRSCTECGVKIFFISLGDKRI